MRGHPFARLGVLAVVCLTLLARVACSNSFGDRHVEDGTRFWQRPWHGAGTLVATPAEAQAHLPFHMVRPHVPDGLRGIYLPPAAEHRRPSLMAVWFTYKSARYGWVWIGQSYPDEPDGMRVAGWQEMVAQNGNPGRAHCEVTQVRETIPAMVCTSNAGGVAEFVQNGVQFNIQGPDLARQDVLEIANNL